MGLLRALLRIVRRNADDDGAVPDDRPVYPPEDQLTLGMEEVLVTLALLVVSYLLLATPCFSIRRRRLRLDGRPGGDWGWMEAAKQIRHVKNVEDLKQWWRRLLLRVNDDGADRMKFDCGRWNEMIRSSHRSNGGGYEDDKTVRAKGGCGRSAPSTPLRSFFRPLAPAEIRRHAMHSSTSDGHLVGSSPARVPRLPPKELKGGQGQQSMYEEDYRPETDHDRFQKAWKTRIRFAKYRRLVLPPECKLVEFSSISRNWREVEQSLLENLLNESRWNKLASYATYARNVFDVICGICTKLFSKESTHRFSAWMMDMFRYRLRRQRGMSVEEDEETDDDDDGSVTTLGSSVAKRHSTKAMANPNLPMDTPVASENLREHGKVDKKVPSLDSVPRLLSQSPNPNDVRSNANDKENSQSDENDSSFMNVTQSANSEKGGGMHVSDKVALLHRPNTPDMNAEMNDDATYHSANGPEHTGILERNMPTSSYESVGIPSSVEHSTKKSLAVSPLPMKHFAKPKKRDALENYRKSTDITPKIFLPHLSKRSLSYGGPNPPPKTVSLMPTPKMNPRNKTEPPALVDASNTMNFFDTANSNRQLRDMSRAVPIPDANGYILGDEFLASSCTPLLVFVNSRSGPQQGHLLITQFRRLLNPIQVWDLADGGPEKVLKSFLALSRFQVLICGGDGTVSWIISALESMRLKRWPPIGILPLGTGNDLARIHGWGGGYNNASLLFILNQISDAYISMLDLWELDITSTSKKGKKRKGMKSFINYLGVGVDAQAALQVHNLRESKPKLFFSRFFNKAWYAIAGGEEAIKSSCANLSRQITLMADGIEIPLPPDSQGIIFLNIDSYSGGVPLWSKGLKPKKKRARRYSEGDFSQLHGNGLTRNESIEDLAELVTSKQLTACDLPSSCQDGLLDVVSIRGTFHLGQIRVGLSNAQLLCQCREATVTLKKKMAVQIDGEPWRQNPSTLRIIRKPDRATMLNRSDKDSGGLETEVTKLLNWANEKDVINQKQYAIMMEEFSRRVEYKKRAQKEKGNGFSFVG